MELINPRVLALSQCRTQIDRAMVHGWYDATAGNSDMMVSVDGSYDWYHLGKRAYYAACWDEMASNDPYSASYEFSRESVLNHGLLTKGVVVK